MPSLFPGMDPFIESQEWESFHPSLLIEIRNALVPQVRPELVVEVERYVYLSAESESTEERIKPDVYVAGAQRPDVMDVQGALQIIELAEPTTVTLPQAEHIQQHYLAIRDRRQRQVVTVIELLSPWNKQPGTGRTLYLSKRENALRSMAHLIELDLLRGGERLPTNEPLPAADYFAFVCRTELLPKANAYHWSVWDPMPTLPVPLRVGQSDATLDLQSIFTRTFDSAGYDYMLDYDEPVSPPLNREDRKWLKSLLKK